MNGYTAHVDFLSVDVQLWTSFSYFYIHLFQSNI
jgi:hypothetical protein